MKDLTCVLKPSSYNAVGQNTARLMDKTALPGEKDVPPPFFISPQMKNEALKLLAILKNAKEEQMLLGRSAMGKQLGERGLFLSDQQIKTRLAYLKKAGFIHSYQGKGTVITKKGEEELCQATHLLGLE